MRELVFLPDRAGGDELGSADGFVRVGKDSHALQTLADRLLLPRQEVRPDHTMWRGVLALALLLDTWPEQDVRVSALAVDGTASLFSAWVLSARPVQERRDDMHLVLLEKNGERRLLGVANAHAGLVLPATKTDFAGFVPARALWYDGEHERWLDPVPYLNEHERAILLARMTLMGLDSPEAAAFKADLNEADKAHAEAVKNGDEQALAALSARLQAVCGMADFEAFSCREEPVGVTADNPLVLLYAAVDVRCEAPRLCRTYLWHGVPFARTSAALGLTASYDPAQAEALAQIEQEAALLAEHSTRWNGRCAAAIAGWLAEQDAALLPQCRAQAEAIRHDRLERARELQLTVSLHWPWDAASGAVRYLLQETLGIDWMDAAAKPFSDYLTKLTGFAMGDDLLQTNCACADGVLLPPLSREMAQCIAKAGEGEGLAADMLRFEPRADGGMEASFLLRGAGEIRMLRTYAAEEILVLTEEESPCTAVWPCLRLESWNAYHIFVKGGAADVAALSGREWRTLAADAASDRWRCLRTDTYPACLVMLKDGACLGALPNTLPLRRVAKIGDAQAAIDLGDGGTAAALTLDGQIVPFSQEPMTRLLVMPQNAAADPFLLSLTPGAVTPSAVMMTGDGDELFTDGYTYAPGSYDALRDLTPGAVACQLKWRADSRSVRARRMLLHQVMLGVCLNAVLAGARSICWRVTVADEMGDEGRNALLNLVDETSVVVADESGLLLKDGKFTVTWAEEAAALHAFLRTEGGMKGTFAALDVGCSSTKLHLWMQGKNRPLGGAVLLEGASGMLLHVLRANPEMLRLDFADCGNEALTAAVAALCEQLERAREASAQADKALLMLDALLDTFKPAIVQHLYNRFQVQRPTYLQSILLEMYAAAAFNVGLMLEHAAQDTNISHLFPADMPICVTGRGAWLLETLTPQQRNALQYIAHAPMQLRHPVRTVTLRPAAHPGDATALGMLKLHDHGATINTPRIRTRQSFSELMRLLVQQLMQCCPMHAWTLHPGLYDQWGNLTPAGEDAIRSLASKCYGEGDDVPAAVMDFIAQLAVTPLMAAAFPGE